MKVPLFPLLALLFLLGAPCVASPEPVDRTSAAAAKPIVPVRRISASKPQPNPAPGAPLNLSEPAPLLLRPSDDFGPSGQPGWFHGPDTAGWGSAKDGEQTILGVYRRPVRPDIPGPQTYQVPEDRSAAGLSLSFQLGH